MFYEIVKKRNFVLSAMIMARFFYQQEMNCRYF